MHKPLLALALSAALSLAVATTADADDSPVAITAAPALEWGFKQSWRIYAGEPAVSAGAAAIPDSGAAPYQLAWDFESGSYDAGTGMTVLRYSGTAHWLKYPATEISIPPPSGYAGPMDIDVLDVTMSDPIVTISADEATISVEAASRQLDTWEMEELGRVPVVSLDVSEVVPTVAAGTTSWSAIPAASAGSSNEVFAGNYPTGRAVDALGFSYVGPGGAPDFSEHWDAPASAKLELGHNVILTEDAPSDQHDVFLLDRQRRLVHYRQVSVVGDEVFWTYRALDLDTFEIGEPLVLPEAEEIFSETFFDSNSGRLFYRRLGETETKRWIRFDPVQGEYVRGTLDTPIPIVGNSNHLIWDPVGVRAINVDLHRPDGVAEDAYDEYVWQLNTYSEQEDGSWVRKAYDMPSFPAGLNVTGYTTSSNINAPTGAVAHDGSLLLLSDMMFSLDPEVEAPTTLPGAYRIVFEAGGDEVSVAPVAGTEVPNDFAKMFQTIQSGPEGRLALMRPGAGDGPRVQTLTVADGAVTAGPAVSVPGLDTIHASSFAVDPEDGTIWLGGWQSQRIVGLRDGQMVSDQFFNERHPRGGPLLTGPGHAVYAQTNDGSPATFGGSPIYGFGRFDRLGLSPTVTAQPSSKSVELGVGETTEAVAFGSDAGGEPAPQRQWQVKPPGATRFTDLTGETGPVLTVQAARGLGGSQYRAVYSNSAGRIASEPAALSVTYAPRVVVDVADTTVTEGDPAVFQVLPEGDPDPEVAWQRRVGGFWQEVATDDNFDVNGGTLTVKDTNTDQSGALFRARLTNSVATVHTRTAELTVEPSTAIPAEGLDLSGVTLDWTGSAELQKAPPAGGSNYFSAGVSDGTEATYAAGAGDVRIWRRPPAGAEAGPTWATRASHVAEGGGQLVRFYAGAARIEPDGSAKVTWDGAFSVNFYGGLVPFTITDPELAVDQDGNGTLKADLSGYGSSMANPGERVALDPVADVTLATFSGVEIDPAGAVTVEPEYDGVEVTVPPGAVPQDRIVAGWGAWPQSFVDFHVGTGLAPYWYSSGGVADDRKRPEPFVVDFAAGAQAPPLAPAGGDADLPPAGELPARAASATSLRFGAVRRSYGARTIATVRVVVAGRAATGVVSVRVGRRTLRRSLADGEAQLVLPRVLRPGRHRVVATFAGDGGIAASSAAARLTVVKARPRLRARVLRASSAGHRRVRVVARIAGAPGVYPVGEVVVRDDDRIVGVGRLRRAHRGRLTLALPRLTRGTHYLRATLAGGALQRPATSPYRQLRIE